MSKAREALERMSHMDYHNVEFNEFQGDLYYSDKLKLEELAIRDEPKPVLHENTMKQFGKCPVCNESVTLRHHRQFCGECGSRLDWIKHE